MLGLLKLLKLRKNKYQEINIKTLVLSDFKKEE